MTENCTLMTDNSDRQTSNFSLVAHVYWGAANTKTIFYEVCIEIQKAKFPADIMRFRNYLGKQYSNKNNVYEQDSRLKACPILSIYILRHQGSEKVL